MMDLSSLSDAQKVALADTIARRIGGHAFGSVPKREIDVALFAGLIAAGYIDADEPQFSLSRKLGITPGRVRGLMYAYRLSTADGGGDIAAIVDHVRVVQIEADGDAVFNVEDAFARDAFEARLKQVDVFTDGSFNRERIIVPTEVFLAALDDALGRDGERLRERIEDLLAQRARDRRLRVVGDVAKKLVGDTAGVTLRALLEASL
ncbi:hypothetical protein LGT39_11540 [Demequina sp. TTPB684]|uniref:hypothetical protein n=1 Tax=unclassified Demequina TaxID=2620311 RepID=UPI001CF46B3D|nr:MULTISPECIES: hypothetical protein [unclassified Demequina]MCB2413478.1 hypothetical protein [Demequina sp. TTPB684]UPU88780.1 hypothetical protein LGT36_002330 [Demequina sp. TMPB413]